MFNKNPQVTALALAFAIPFSETADAQTASQASSQDAAQTMPSTDASGTASDGATLPAISVTGNGGTDIYRVSEVSLGVLGNRKLTDTPFSISVLTHELLENQQAQYYGDYLKNDPSVTTANVPVGFNTLRGFNVGTSGYLFDGLPDSQPLSDGRYQIIGVERIEVLKGPSAFLNGLGASSSLGGTFNFVPKKPEDDPVRSVSTGITSRSILNASVDLGNRFGANKQFGYRFNVGVKDGKQETQDAKWKQAAATLALDWRVNPDLVLSGGFEYAVNSFPRSQPFYVLARGLQVPAAPRAKRNRAQPWDNFRTEGTNIWLRADYQVTPDWTLTAQALHSSDVRPNTKEARFGLILDANGNAALSGQEDGGSKTTGDTLQVSMRGSFSTAGVSHSLTVAAAGTRTEASTGTTITLGTFNTNLYNPTFYPEPAHVDNGPLLRRQKTSTSSLLLSDIAQFNDQWSVLVGLRYAQLGVDNYNRLQGTIRNTNALTKLTPATALMFKPTASSLVYLSYAQGIQPGGTAPAGTANAKQVLSPIVTTQVELGAKLETKSVLWTAALFDMRKPFEYVNSATMTYVQNGLQRHKGLELTASGKLTSHLSLLAGVMLLDPSTSNTGVAATEGRRPLGVANVVVNVFAEHRIPAVPGLYLNGGVYHSGPQYLDAANTQKVQAWTRVDAGLRYETRYGSTPVDLLFNVENLTGKDYWAGAQGGILTLAEPRTFKATARFAF